MVELTRNVLGDCPVKSASCQHLTETGSGRLLACEDRATLDGSRRGPLIDGAFRPHWNRNGTNVLSFANQVSDYPMLLANLEIFHSESNQFSPSQTASDEQRQNRPITLASETV